MATIKEVAKACGVSIATVSNILNGTGRAGDKTKALVIRTAKEMNYVPNLVAKNLKQKKTKIIGVITEDLTVFNCAEIVDGINEKLEEEGYFFLLGNLRLFKKYDNMFYHHEGYSRQVLEEIQIMQSKLVEGIIYVGAHCRKISCLPTDGEIPIVVAYGLGPDQRIPSVIYDDEKAAYDATSALIQRGHTRIGLILGEMGSLHTAERQIGYEKALYDHQILCNPSYFRQGDWSREKGYQASKELVEEGVTAIFAMNDMMAAGVYDYANDHGMKIGKDLAVIGFDNQEISTAFSPELATVALPLGEMGKQTADILIRMIEEKQNKEKPITKIACKLIERESI